MPDFPSELVEAAAKAAMEAEPGQNWECATAKEADVYLRDSLAVLAAVLPLIEQRVIDRLAREAGENPYCNGAPREWDPYPHASDVWHEAAACGVAAERARGDKLRDAGDALASELARRTCRCTYLGDGDVLSCGRCAALDVWRAALSSPAEPDTGEEPS